MAEPNDWKKARNGLVAVLRMRTDPVGVKLLKASEMAELSDVKVLRTTAVCQMIAMSRYGKEGGIVAASVGGVKCLWATACLGMTRSPERLVRGDLNRAFVRDEMAGKALQDMIFAIGDGSRPYGGILTAPLDLFPGEPDVVVMYLTPGQALKVILALSYDRGEVTENPITGQAAVCQSIARAMISGKVAIEIPCVGDRMYGLVQDDELVVVVPASRTRQILDGMKGTDAFAPYPFTPFLWWPALFPPEFEPTRSELDLD
ncbi:MAG: DUF169 domain-containing protein [Euryarchaeota archaeon]|nr:DUF169 domain-containing protein [Euryarchaeota archaeon]